MCSDRIAFASDTPFRRISPRAASAFTWVADWKLNFREPSVDILFTRIRLVLRALRFMRITRADLLPLLLLEPRLIRILLCCFGPRLVGEDFGDACRMRMRAPRFFRRRAIALMRLPFIMLSIYASRNLRPDVKRQFCVRSFAVQKT